MGVRFGLAAAVAVLVAAAPASASEPPGARAFVGRLIAFETRGGTIRDAAFFNLLAPRLRAAVRRDLVGPDVGVLDYDPICDCQDDTGLVMRVVSLAGTGDRAVAVVVNRFPADRTTVRFHLARVNGRWRLADIGDSDRPSLLRALEDANGRSR